MCTNIDGVNTIVMVCGSRGWADARSVESRLVEVYNRVGDDLIVVHNDHGAVDRIAAAWCDRWRVTHVPFSITEAEWAEHGRMAPQRRNQAIVEFLADQRDDLGAAVELLVFRLPDDSLSREADRLKNLATGQRITGSVVHARLRRAA